LDVVDPSEMRAANSPIPGGISFHDVLEIWRALRRTEKLKSIEVSGYNPLKDNYHLGVRRLTELLSRVSG